MWFGSGASPKVAVSLFCIPVDIALPNPEIRLQVVQRNPFLTQEISMDNPIRNAVISACRMFMIPIARFLLRYGFSYREFAEIAKWAFVRVATDEYGLRGRVTNVSRVAVMTGLSRKEVRRIRETAIDLPNTRDHELSLPARVLSFWHQDMDFIGPNGDVMELELESDSISFSVLVRRACGDVPAGAILRELMRAGSVKQTSEGRLKAVKRYFVPEQTDPKLVERLGLRVRDLVTTIDYNMTSTDDPVRRFEATAYNNAIPMAALPRFKRVVADQGLRFLESIDDWLTAYSENQAEGDVSCIRTGVGLYVFEGDEHSV